MSERDGFSNNCPVSGLLVCKVGGVGVIYSPTTTSASAFDVITKGPSTFIFLGIWETPIRSGVWQISLSMISPPITVLGT